MLNNKLLIVHHGALGDVVLTFPTLICLRRTFHEIDALFQDALGKLAANLNLVDKWFALEAAFFAALYFEPVDPALKNFLRSYDSILLFSYSKQLKRTIQKTTNQNVYRIPPKPHTDQSMHVCRHIFTHLVKNRLIKDLNYNQIGFAEKAGYERRCGYDPAQILIHPGSGSRRKNWPVLNFVKTAEILESKGMHTQFILGPADHHLFEPLSTAGTYNKKIQLVEDLEKLTLLLKTAGGFIGNDSGIGHLAGFLGLPTLTVFGPSDPQRWRPVGCAIKVLRPVLDCRPCFEKTVEDCQTMECLIRTSPQTVADVFHRLMAYSTSFPSFQYSLDDPPLAQV